MTDTGPASSAPSDDVEPVANETRDRIITGLVTGLPIVSLAFVAWQAWGGWLYWRDLAIFAGMYVITGFGITVGFHRLFTHRAFQTVQAGRVHVRDPRLDGPPGPDDLLGRPTTASITPTPTRRATRTARTSGSRPGGIGNALRGLGTRTSAGCSSTPSAGWRAQYAPDLLEDPGIAALAAVPVAALATFALPALLGGLITWSWTWGP